MSRAGMNASGEMAGVGRRRGKERILNAEGAEGAEMRKKEDPRPQTKGVVPLGMTLGGSANMPKTMELGVHFYSRASTRATLYALWGFMSRLGARD